LSPGNLIEAEQNTLVMQGLTNQIPSLRGNMCVVLPKDLCTAHRISDPPFSLFVYHRSIGHSHTRTTKINLP